MAKQPVQPERYAQQLKRIQHALDIGLLHTPWANSADFLKDDVFAVLAFCVDLLPDEETEIDAKVLVELLAEIESLEEALKSSEVPERLREMMLRQIDAMRSAIEKYSIVGARGLRAAARAATVEIIENEKEIRAHPASKELSRFGKLVARARAVTDDVIRGQGAIETANKIAGFLEDLFK